MLKGFALLKNILKKIWINCVCMCLVAQSCLTL